MADRVSLATSRTGLDRYDGDSITQESFRSILSANQQAGQWEPADEVETRAVLGTIKVTCR
jgi:hypothetical protein